MAQSLRPASDISVASVNGWLSGVMGGSIYPRLDDDPYPLDVAPYQYGVDDTVGVIFPCTLEVKFGAGVTPGARSGYPGGSPYESGHAVKFTYLCDHNVNMEFQLKQGGTVIATTGVITPTRATQPTPVERVLVLTPAESATISDYTDLRFKILDGGSNPSPGVPVSMPSDPAYMQYYFMLESVLLVVPDASLGVRRRVRGNEI